MADHAILSASGASRWLACTPSARLEQGLTDTAGDAAAEGTLAHSIAEVLIKGKLGWLNPIQVESELRDLKANKLYTPEMLDYMEEHSAFVIERFLTRQAVDPATVIFLEQKLDTSEYIPGGFCTGDVVIIGGRMLEIIDLKYGKGVPVNALDNKQLRVYALGALTEFGYLYDILEIGMFINQPRLNSTSSDNLLVSHLLQWANEELKPRAELAYKGLGDYVPGEHCRFCRAKATCRALADHNMALMRYDFQSAFLLTDEEITDILKKLDLLQQWGKAVQAHVFAQALGGKKWPGLKLVEGRSNRVITDTAAAAKTLAQAGYTMAQYYEPLTMLGITKLETNIGKNKLKELLADYILKPTGAPVLAPEDDPRPELNSAATAAEDFKDIVF